MRLYEVKSHTLKFSIRNVNAVAAQYGGKACVPFRLDGRLAAGQAWHSRQCIFNGPFNPGMECSNHAIDREAGDDDLREQNKRVGRVPLDEVIHGSSRRPVHGRTDARL